MKTTKQILMTVAVLLLSATASAYDFEVDGFYYNILSASDFTVEVTSGDNKYSGDIVIPETMVYKSRVLKVTSIGNYAFRDCSSLTSITIPKSVTSIGSHAFYNCSSLTTINIPESVTSIGNYAFYDCSGLTAITIPTNVTDIGDKAFYNCSSLTTINIPESVTSIGNYAFSGCSSLERVTINRAYVDDWFFRNSSIKEVVLGEGVSCIKERAFYGCSGLTAIAIPGSVTRIDDEAFSGCTSLKDLVIEDGDGTLSLGYNCCEKYTMGQGLFYDCPLECLYLGRDLAYDSSYECGYSPFSNKETLTAITIGNSVTSIGEPFYGCNAIERVELNSPSIGGWFSGKISLKEVVIGNSVTDIGDKAFYGCSSLTSITIPKSVTSIGDKVFFDCSGLVTIHLLGKTPPSNRGDNFTEGQFVNTTLYVPQGSLAAYQSADVWKNFWDIREKDVTETPDVEVKKCVAPTISYNDNGLDIATDTEGAEILSTITCSDVNSYNSSRIDFSATYSITAYAAKPGCEDSESVTATLCWIAVSGNSGEDGIIEVKAMPVLITCMDGTISIRGGQEGTEVLVYSVNGVSIGNATITNGNATINTTLAKGEIAVVSIVGRSFKVVIQ